MAREGLDIDMLQSDYRKVALWSAGRARDDYLAGIQASNPDSPLMRLPRSSLIEADVKSVTPVSDDSPMVRFDTWRRDRKSVVKGKGGSVRVGRGGRRT